MLCWALGFLALLAGPSARGVRALLGAWPVAIVASGAVGALAIVIPHHLDHYRERAQARDRTVIAEILASPLCAGPPG